MQAKWMGRCPECGEWNTLVETVVESSPLSTSRPGLATGGEAQPLSEISTEGPQRVGVPMKELDRVLGGGIVPGSLVLISGDPGIGKSTLLLQVGGMLSTGGHSVLYVSAEESAQQIKLRADRLSISCPNLYVLAETNLDRVLPQISRLKPLLVVIDSIQAMHLDSLESSPGSVSQVKECANVLLHLAKSENIPIFMVGHVTKTGAIAGPRILEHIVDAVLYLEGERFHAFRLLRSVKNRFGSTNEVGVFEMRDSGMAEVENPSFVFLEERPTHAAGSAIGVTMEGTRPLLIEIQALASRSALEHPRYTCNGVDLNRLWLLAAVLGKRVGLRVHDQDIFVNVVGGLRVREPAIDLAVAVAIASSLHGRPIHADMAMFGEVGLSGELRSVSHAERRLREAAKLGFKRGLFPAMRGTQELRGLDVEPVMVRSLAEAVDLALEH